ncbi:phosphatase PAP2 family protein [Thalassotalea mangrovi]|uniref:undecaprenyl-diphosphate phosphatase n=1 Tax=Thalassotalea mangrovi TaxID=2572245 RepID=A0A4U1B3V9_9GAMM|nr:phosphatase PAP2 family protein [Thalassotalea mangrovi]TKB44709.1 phosphatase PAP2 family protein [Thalassotalea mangrovi]
MAILNSIYQADLRILLWCRKGNSCDTFLTLVRNLSRTGDGYLQLLLPCSYWLLAGSQATDFFILTLQAFIIERSLYVLLKNTLRRRRPPQVVPDFSAIIQASDKFSFPSGHTMAAFTLAGLFIFHLGAVAAPLYLWAGAVGLSRVILGVHFPSDIVAGATIGTGIAYTMVVL